ncbi:SdpI family protein [Spirosoma migulaei]
MKTNSTSAELLMVVLMLSPLVYLGIVWNQLPAEIATHFDLQGNPNDWQRKETAALLIGGLSVFLYLVLRFLPALDLRGQLQMSSNYQKLRFAVTLLFAAMMIWLFYMAGHPADTKFSTSVILALVGLMLAGMGNYLTSIKPNWFVGIRTPWTIGNETVWRKTHRLGGRLMVAGGLLSAVLALVVPMSYKVGCVLGVTMLTVLIPVVYSYIYSQQEKRHQLN